MESWRNEANESETQIPWMLTIPAIDLEMDMEEETHGLTRGETGEARERELR